MSVPRLGVLLALLACAGPASLLGQTTLTFGGYVKLDMLSTKYFDGNVAGDSPLRDIHFPAAIPVGSDNNVFANFDFHVKESRFNLETRTLFSNGEEIRAFVELDFLLGGQGDERVSNSFNPRIRHFFFTYGKLLLGQTWSTFMVVEPIVDDLDFGGTADGFIFNRQPQLRFTTGAWQFAVENPETTLDSFGGGSRIVTEAAALPDLVGRYNMSGDWGTFAVSGILRQLKYEFTSAGATEANNALGFGVSAGGRINVGETDDVRFQASAGAGLGRYAAFNFANAAVVDSVDRVNSTPSYLGFVGYRHFWSEQLRTNVNVSAIFVNNEEVLSGTGVNKSAYSVSANLLYSPLPPLTFGVELMQGYRQVEGGADGRFVRLQLAGKYDFRFTAAMGGSE
jgi:hypothetical protein